MTRLTLLLIIASICIATSCSSSRPSTNPMDYDIAWNEDTVNSYQIALSKKGSFYYRIETRDTVVNYKGKYGAVANEIYLKFTGNKPAGFKPYLVVEASGNYYIQHFTDGRKRIFLRIHQWPHR
jgi:hypothetical protein